MEDPEPVGQLCYVNNSINLQVTCTDVIGKESLSQFYIESVNDSWFIDCKQFTLYRLHSEIAPRLLLGFLACLIASYQHKTAFIPLVRE